MDEEVALYLAAFLVGCVVEGGIRGYVEAKVRMHFDQPQQQSGPTIDQVLSAHEERLENVEERDEEREEDVTGLHVEIEELKGRVDELVRRRR